MNRLSIYTLRNGLPRLRTKLERGTPVTVAYLGGSITQASPDGYAYQTTAWCKARYPATAFTEVNAGIGGTGSDFGAYRLRPDVLTHKPDLLVVEFAVNDSGEGHAVQEALEGIVRHTRQALGETCEIVFVYALAKTCLEALQADRLPPGSRLHEPVAEHYGVMSVNVALDVARRLKAGELTWEEFSQDSCHPVVRGHHMYCMVLAEALSKALAVPDTPHPLPPPMTKDPWDNADVIPISPTTAFPEWTYTPMENRGGWECYEGLLESHTPGSEAAFAFTGSAIGLLYSLGPETGDLLWAVDGGELKPARLFDDYAERFWRPSYRILASGLTSGPHRLRVQVGVDRDPRSKGHAIRLASLLVR